VLSLLADSAWHSRGEADLLSDGRDPPAKLFKQELDAGELFFDHMESPSGRHFHDASVPEG